MASLLEAVWRVGQQLRLERCAHGLGHAVLRAQRRFKRTSVIGAGEAPDHARRAGALLEQALDAARFARDTRLHIARREVRQVHVMRRLVVLALLRRDVAAEVKRGVEAGRLDACRAHVLLAVGQQLRVQRARAPLVRSKVDAADAAPARQPAQREHAPEHGHVADRALVQVVDRKVGPVDAEAVAGKDDGMVCEQVRHSGAFCEDILGPRRAYPALRIGTIMTFRARKGEFSGSFARFCKKSAKFLALSLYCAKVSDSTWE